MGYGLGDRALIAAPVLDSQQRVAPDSAVLDCILANTREMKKLALKAGLSRVALILEMAELEAADHLPKSRHSKR